MRAFVVIFLVEIFKDNSSNIWVAYSIYLYPMLQVADKY